MSDLGVPLAIVTAYVGALVAAAAWGERQEARGRRIVSNRLVYSLSISVYATSWTFYGSIGFAARNGLLFLTVYLGPTLCAIAWWWVLRGLVRLKEHQRIAGLADLLSLRYGRSQQVALLVTGVAVVGLVPYLALQLKTMVATLAIVAGDTSSYPEADSRVGPPLVVLMLAFTIAFGLRRLRPTERHPGLVFALAIECVVKLVAFIAAGVFVTWGLFHGPGDIFRRAAISGSPAPDLLGGHGVLTWLSHLLLSGVAVMLLPRQFHVEVVECADEDHVRTASWVFPLYLLAINLFVLPVALAGLLLGHPTSAADTFLLRLPLDAGRPLLSWLVFLGGFSAGIGMVVVETTALATMFSNHVVMPAAERFAALGGLRRRILAVRWVAAAILLLAASGYERLFGQEYPLSSIGFISFAAVLQLAPPLLGGLWDGASRTGALAGLGAGLLAWFYTLVVPVIAHSGWLPASLLTEGPFGLQALRPEGLFDLHLDPVSNAVLWSLLANGAAFLGGSLLFPPRPEEIGLAGWPQGALAPPDVPATAGAPPLVRAAEKRDRAAALLARYHGAEDGRRLADACLAKVTSEPAGMLSALQLAELQAEVEMALAAAIGTPGARAAVQRDPLVTAQESRDVSAAYAEILASLNVSPAELQRKIDYYRERERLLARDVAHQRFLSGVSGLLAASLDLEATARTAVRLPVPILADAALLWVGPAHGQPPRAWFAHVDATVETAGATAADQLAGSLATAERVVWAVTRRRPFIVHPPVPPAWPPALAAHLPTGGEVTIPLVGASAVLGTLSLFVEPGTTLRPADDLGIAEELSRRLALAIENARLYQQAEVAIRARDEFLAVASHELKTPLTPLRLKIQMLQRLLAHGDLGRVPRDKLEQLFGGAEGQVVRLVGLVDDLLDVTRLTTNRLKLHPELIDLSAVARDVLERHAAEALQAGCQVLLATAKPALGSWDRLRMEQVLTNLLTNAFKYAPGTEVRISVDADDLRARLVVHDEGPGIAPLDQERIFRAFERAVRLMEVSGFGLGLFIVRQIVEAHGGTVRLDSQVGRGSTFRIDLPRAPPAQA